MSVSFLAAVQRRSDAAQHIAPPACDTKRLHTVTRRPICSGSIRECCEENCPGEPAVLFFMHCSGRLKMISIPPGEPAGVLSDAEALVSGQVGGARHHVLRLTGERLSEVSADVEAAEQLLVCLEGANFHLSPLCVGAIAAQFPLPRSASQWLDVPTADCALADYLDAVNADGSPPPLPEVVYSVAFALRHDQPSPLPWRRPPPTAAVPSPLEYGAQAGPPIAESDSLASHPLPIPCPTTADVEGGAAAVSPPAKRKSKRASKAAREPAPAVGMCGFSADECALLLEHGARPWDDDAEEVLMQLKQRAAAGAPAPRQAEASG